MPSMLEQIRASKLPSNMMQFAARGALSVPPGENIEILVYLAKHNKVFGDLARMTLAGWEEKASLAAASDPKTSREVLDYFISPENLRPKLLPALLENPSVSANAIAKMAQSASGDAIAPLLASSRVRAAKEILQSLRSNPYLKPNDASVVAELLSGSGAASSANLPENGAAIHDSVPETSHDAVVQTSAEISKTPEPDSRSTASLKEDEEVPEEIVSAYLAEHAAEIGPEEGKPFQAVGGIVDLLGSDYFPVVEVKDIAESPEQTQASSAGAASAPAVATKGAATKGATRATAAAPKRENTMQKINGLDVKGRIQLALKGNKEERSILIRDGTKVVALSVLEAPKLADGEVEKFASQKNVLEAVLRQIPLKRRFMKNYIVVRNLVANPRTPLDLSLGLMKHLLAADLKNLSANKDVPETVRSLALKMFKQKQDAANKK
ncbi:MAG: hypothetical protein ABR874_10605 [Candidatus Sulfotelmatobacter sp.]